ncbi:MAG: hypothetical protein IIY73_00685, partial [Solobacterium sp.]|nr:hypothetical protein [Solobacterium sp.]
MKKGFKTALSSLLAVAVLAGCSGGNEGGSEGGEETPVAGDQILKFGTSGFEGVFNPILSDNVYDSYITALIFDGLVDVDGTGEYVPELATWELDEETKTVYTFTLRDGLTFSDGTPLTANDVAYTYNTIKEADYAGPRTAVGAAIADINVIDDKTIAFTMTD